MAASANGTIVLVRFPFSDLSGAKLRPALVLAQVGRDDIVLCQITSRPYADALAIEIAASDLQRGTLDRTSYIRPGKLFTGNQTIIARDLGRLNHTKFNDTVKAVIDLFESSIR